MELLETAYPEVIFDTPDTRPFLRAVLDDSLERKDLPDQECEERRLQTALASTPLLSFRCPLPLKEAQIRVRLPRRYPGSPLIATVEGTPRVKASARETIAGVAEAEAIRLSGELRGEPHCLQVLGEVMRVSVDLADSEFGGVGAPSNTAAATAAAASEFCDDKLCGAGNSRGGDAVEPDGSSIFLGRRLIYSHHIIATQKRTGIIKTARELGLGGFSKVRIYTVVVAVMVVVMDEGSLLGARCSRSPCWILTKSARHIAQQGTVCAQTHARTCMFVSLCFISITWLFVLQRNSSFSMLEK